MRISAWLTPNRRWLRRRRCRRKANVFISVKDSDKEPVIPVAREFIELGFRIIATSGTAAALAKAEIKVTKVFKLREGRPNVLDRVKNGDVQFHHQHAERKNPARGRSDDPQRGARAKRFRS